MCALVHRCGLHYNAKTGLADTHEEFEGQFAFRFNDVSARQDEIELRRRVPIPDFGEKTTYNCAIPMQKNLLFALAPFEVYEFKCLIELSTNTKTMNGKSYQVRPNIMLSERDERELFIVRKQNELDAVDTYTIVTEAPRIRAIYDCKKEYCPKYEVTFYLEQPMHFKLVTIYLPLLLIATLATLNIYNGMGVDVGGADLENSIAIALTLVFILPGLAPTGTDTVHGKGFGRNDFAIMLLFGGILIGSILHPSLAVPYKDGDNITATKTDLIGKIAVAFIWISFLIPIWTYVHA